MGQEAIPQNALQTILQNKPQPTRRPRSTQIETNQLACNTNQLTGGQ